MGLSARLQKIHDIALQAARGFKRAESELIHALIMVDSERVFVKLGFNSLFNYTVESLRLSEATAYNMITVARKVREVPELGRKIEEGLISISKAKKIAPVLTFENQAEWLKKAETLTSRKLEQEVARENPRAATPEKAIYVSGDRLELSLGVSEELMAKIRHVQNLVSQAKGCSASLEETLEEMTSLYVKHKDPVEKAKRSVIKNGAVPHSTNTATESPTTPLNSQVPGPVRIRIPIPAHIAHAVRLRDKNTCQYRAPGKDAPCGSKRWVDLHHIKPVSQGGPNTVENLITLCRTHHQEVH